MHDTIRHHPLVSLTESLRSLKLLAASLNVPARVSFHKYTA
jgi:hypothetical protein